jgi:hypothetical protein
MVTVQLSNEALRYFIVETVLTKKPENSGALIKLVQQQYPLNEKEIYEIILELEAEKKLTLKKQVNAKSAINYFFSASSLFYWIIIVVSLGSTISAFTILPNSYFYIRQILAALYVFFVPGIALLKALYPINAPLPTGSESTELIQRVILGCALSIALTAIIGLALSFSPLGIRLIPVAVTSLVFTLVFASVAFWREYKIKTKSHLPPAD